MELKIEHLSKQFKDKTAVNDVNLQKRAGLSTAVRMAPFILTVDWLGWLCYFLDEKQFIRIYFHHCHSKPHEWNTLFLGF